MAASHPIRVPEIGESIREVQIGRWLKQEGQAATRDESLVEIESDKATVELPAPVAGTVTRILKRDGQTAEVGEVIGYLEEGAEAARSSVPSGEAALGSPLPLGEGQGEGRSAADQPQPVAEPQPAEEPQAATEERATPEPPPFTPSPRHLFTPSPPHPLTPSSSIPRLEQTVPMSPIRRRIAERLVQAQQTAAILTSFNEIDMSAVIAMRKQHREAFQERYGVKLGLMSFFVKAVIDGLKLHRELNAEIRGRDMVYRSYYDIGVAVGGGKGLVVPVLRNAERMTFADIERAIADFAERARDNKIKLEELEGGTFTITNGGVYGSLLSTPILNPPQSGILGMHAIQDRPVARDGQVVIRPMMYVALSYDHRLVDGREAVGFLTRVKELIEDPSRMLLQM